MIRPTLEELEIRFVTNVPLDFTKTKRVGREEVAPASMNANHAVKVSTAIKLARRRVRSVLLASHKNLRDKGVVMYVQQDITKMKRGFLVIQLMVMHLLLPTARNAVQASTAI